MGLRIQNNIAAMNAHNNLKKADSGMSTSLNRLSSGFRINKAADDAAGLSISNQFRADIASFNVASRNTSEANSLLQVAEGGLDQIGNMLTRLKELATQASSANSGSNLSKIDAEAEQLKLEIDRIATKTEYADVALINGSYGITVGSKAAGLSGTSGFSNATGMKSGQTYNIDTTVSGTAGTMVLSSDGMTETAYFTRDTDNGTTDVFFKSQGVTITVDSNAASATTDGDITAGTSGNSAFQIGAENTADDRLNISLGDATQSGLNISSLDLSTASNAQTAIDTIDTAIGSLNTVRGDIGAYMNRLSYASANLATTVENVQAAESVIRDVDMAAEMTSFTKNQILMQAGTSMLAQANMAPQQILSLVG